MSLLQPYITTIRTVFKVGLPKCEQYKGNTDYRGAVAWNLLPVNQRNMPLSLYTQFKYIQKKEMAKSIPER